MKTNNIRNLLLATLILLEGFNSSNLYAQTAELQLFEGLAEGFSSSQAERPLTEDDSNPEEEPNSERQKSINPMIFKDPDYGYTGGDSFDNKPLPRRSNETLQYFGYDFFTKAPSTFVQSNLPVPVDYIIGPGDNFKIYLFGNLNREFTTEVSREGSIIIPELGPVSVAGLTFSEAKATIGGLITSKIIGTDFDITMGALKSINVFIMGEAYQPGLYTVGSLSTLANAIFVSGGITPSGSLRNIKLKRNGATITEFDFYDLLLNGDTSKDKRLMQNDVIFISPIEKTAAIKGEVSRPGIYELKKGDELKDLIRFAGNLKPKASSELEIERIDRKSNSYRLLQKSMANADSKFEITNGDVVNVPSVTNMINDVVLLSGHVQQPGLYAWNEGMRVSDLITKDKLLSMTDLSYVLIMRETAENQHEYIQVDITNLDKEINIDDPIIKNRDHIILLPSLLKPEQITTRMILDEYQFDENNQLVLVDEWTSLTQLRKSLMEETLSVEKTNSLLSPTRARSSQNQNLDNTEPMRRYYEYSVYNYCTLPESIAVKIIEQSGFRAKKSLPIEELEKINSPAEIVALQKEVENERIRTSQNDDQNLIGKDITSICRKQLLDPILQVINREIGPDNKRKVVRVLGNVHFPGEYPLTNGMDLSDAIKSAGGLKDSTYEAEVELNRTNRSDKKTSVFNTIASLSDQNSMSKRLSEDDVINIKEITSVFKTVKITGEVYFEGEYPISENQTLTELIKRAGGLTQYAYPKAAKLQRKALKEAEQKRLSEARSELKRKIVLSSQSGGLGQDSLSGSAIEQLTSLLVDDSTSAEALGRLVIDMDAILSGNEADLILQDGDTLHIPKIQQTVSVIGEVYVPNAHVFRDDLTIQDYISFSGGVNSFADSGNIYLVKADGSIISPSEMGASGFFRGKVNGLEQGDTIVVPLQVQPFSTIKATTEVTQIIYQMALAAAAVNSF